MRRDPRVFSIPAGVPFLPTLADELLGGRFGLTGDPRDDPLALADVTVLLPTRRSARSFREVLLGRLGGTAAILPRIRPIGDVDEDESILAAPAEQPADTLLLPPAIAPLDRLLTLARLILAWSDTVGRTQALLGPDEPRLVPASAADAFHLAGDLARLMDDMHLAGLDWRALETLAPDDYAQYWQLTLSFLRIATEAWPAILAERGLADPVARRDRLLREEAARLAAAPPRGPVVAAGSTGSISATAALLAAIARLPTGAVVLPALDQDLDEAAWAAIGDEAPPAAFGMAAPAAPSHPQFGLRQLIAAIGIDRASVVPLGTPDPALAARARLLGEAMRPAGTTEVWAAAPPPPPEALAGIGLVVARNEQEEALAIAIALREAVETEGHVAALVTPDRAIARRVAVELRRWDLRIDDSAGQPLGDTPQGLFVRLLAEAALSGDPVRLLALAKHPLAAFGLPRNRARKAARALEIAALRGARLAGGAARLADHLATIRLEAEMTPGRAVPPARRRLFRDDWALAEQLARALARALAPLQALADAPPGGHAPAVRVDAATRLLAAALDIAVTDAEGNAAAFWQETAGEALAELLGGLLAGGQLNVPPQEFPGFLAAAMRSVTVTPAVGADTRIHIWGTLEARLQSVDRLILAGLDETVWPGETRTDPWLSRRMRAVIGLPPPERRIGQAAHDFTAALATGEIIVSRAEKRGGAPTVPSRWLQRITALVDKDGAAMMLARGDRYVALARRLEHVAPEEIRPAPRPEPRPPVAARPRQLSISDIERLIRDPYSIYARKVLRLDPLEPLGRPADARLRGTLVHEALSRFTLGWQRPFDDDARRDLLRIWAELFREIEDFPEVHAVWWLRSQAIAAWVIDWEAGRDGIARRHAEIAGRIEFEAPGGPFRLTGRADRIDLRSDGRVEIFDYKTGNPPTARQVLPFQPQLALEAAMVTQGGFGDAFAGRSVAELAWIGLGRVGKGDPVSCAYEEPWTPDSIGVEAHSRLKALIARYDDVAKGYPSKAKPMFERGWPGDYDHLARVAEWRLGSGRKSA